VGLNIAEIPQISRTGTLVSAGKDGVLDVYEPQGAMGQFTSDIIFSNGSFVQWPEGVQR